MIRYRRRLKSFENFLLVDEVYCILMIIKQSRYTSEEEEEDCEEGKRTMKMKKRASKRKKTLD